MGRKLDDEAVLERYVDTYQDTFDEMLDNYLFDNKKKVDFISNTQKEKYDKSVELSVRTERRSIVIGVNLHRIWISTFNANVTGDNQSLIHNATFLDFPSPKWTVTSKSKEILKHAIETVFGDLPIRQPKEETDVAE